MTNLLSVIKSLEPTFIELIQKKFGLVIHVNQAEDLARTIFSACNKFNYSPQDYLDHLTHCPKNSHVLTDLLTSITVGESYFFRDKNQINLLKYKLIPNLIKQKQQKNELSLKIWSAGCSTGEEIYTITMLLNELIPHLDAWELFLLGTDLNTCALEKAELGNYGQWSMRSISDKYLQQYFVKNNHSYIISPKIRELVQFKYLNLCDNSYPSIINGIYEIDLILCRNVLLYFDNELVAQIMKKLSECMNNHAYLLLGASDPIITSGTNLIFHHHEAIYFTLAPSEELNKDF